MTNEFQSNPQRRHTEIYSAYEDRQSARKGRISKQHLLTTVSEGFQFRTGHLDVWSPNNFPNYSLLILSSKPGDSLWVWIEHLAVKRFCDMVVCIWSFFEIFPVTDLQNTGLFYSQI
jgi:hypothetical protein